MEGRGDVLRLSPGLRPCEADVVFLSSSKASPGPRPASLGLDKLEPGNGVEWGNCDVEEAPFGAKKGEE